MRIISLFLPNETSSLIHLHSLDKILKQYIYMFTESKVKGLKTFAAAFLTLYVYISSHSSLHMLLRTTFSPKPPKQPSK